MGRGVEVLREAEVADRLVRGHASAGGAVHGSAIRIEDFTEALEVEASVSHKDHWMIVDKENKGEKAKEDDREEIEKFEIGGKKPVAAAAS